MVNTTKLNQIGQIAVNVRDLEVAVAFYRDVLGMDFLFQVPDMAIFDEHRGKLRPGDTRRPRA